jgi:hypothetical protein
MADRSHYTLSNTAFFNTIGNDGEEAPVPD